MRKLRWILASAFLCAATAQAGDTVDIERLAARSGLTADQVRMVLGNYTPHAEYRTSYVRSRNKLVTMLGQAQFEELAAAYRERQTTGSQAG